MFIDTHTHIYTHEFADDRAEVVARAQAAGARMLLLPNIDAASVEPMLQLCEQYPGLCFPMMGLHPTELPPDPAPLLSAMRQRLSHPDHPFVAVGEVGIDLYWDDSRRAEQMQVFAMQAEWAAQLHLPLVVHCRSAHREVVDVLRPMATTLGGVFHCFGGTTEEARELLDTFPHFVLGIGGVLTFRKSTLPQTLADAVPLHRLVVETDAPYLAPTPHRGQRNEPAYIPLVLQKLADVYARPLDEVARTIMQNTLRTFPRLPQHL